MSTVSNKLFKLTDPIEKEKEKYHKELRIDLHSFSKNSEVNPACIFIWLKLSCCRETFLYLAEIKNN